MSVRDFDRIWYEIDRGDGLTTLVRPFRRICWDPNQNSLVVQHPLTSEAIKVEAWQRAEQGDIDAFRWGSGKPIEIAGVIDQLLLTSNITPWLIDGIEEGEQTGTHYDGHNAKYFTDEQWVTHDDIKIAAYEEIDPDAADRITDYILIEEDDETSALCLYPADAEHLGGEQEYMSAAGTSRWPNLEPLQYAVLEHVGPNQWVLVAATATLERAELVAELRRADHDGRGRAKVLPLEGAPLPLQVAVSLDWESVQREDLIAYATGAVADTIEFALKDGDNPMPDDTITRWSADWKAIRERGGTKAIEREVARILDYYPDEQLADVIESAIATAVNVFVKRDKSGLGLVAGKVIIHSLADKDWIGEWGYDEFEESQDKDGDEAF